MRQWFGVGMGGALGTIGSYPDYWWIGLVILVVILVSLISERRNGGIKDDIWYVA